MTRLRRDTFPTVAVLILAVCLVCLATGRGQADPARTALSDLRVLYLYDDPESIDWPSLYYLNDFYGARIDLVTCRPGDEFNALEGGLRAEQIYTHSFMLPDSSAPFDSIAAHLFNQRRSDVVIIGDLNGNKLARAYASYLTNLKADTSALFQLVKVYRQMDTVAGGSAAVNLNSRELATTYQKRMAEEIPKLFPWFSTEQLRSSTLMHYQLLASRLPRSNDVDFITGLPPNRLTPLLDSLLPDGPIKDALTRRSRNYVSMVSVSSSSFGKKRVEQLLTGLQELRTLQDQARAESRLSQTPQFGAYLSELSDKLQAVVLDEIGLKWEGKIVLRESVDGPKVKFVATLASDGPIPIELHEIRFKPYWDTAVVTLDAVLKQITPHQMFVREYLVDIDRRYLEAQKAESLQFVANIAYGQMPFEVTSAVPIWETPDLAVTFEPDFLFMPPLAQANDGHDGRSLSWRAVITKPTYYYGTVQLHLETPRGVFAEAYQTERPLRRGRATEVVRIPFTISNLFELGVQQATLTLSADGRQVAADTALLRIASCDINKDLRIAFLPDTSGSLEDVLRMTGASFQPLTDRSLIRGDLDRYDVIIVGSGAAREFRSLREAKGQLEDFVRRGGSLIVLGQPTDWPPESLPVGFTPGLEKVSGADLSNRLPNANMLSKPYSIADRGLFDALGRKIFMSPAVVTPAENVYVTPSGAALLAVSRLGDGQIIYCGLPVLALVSQLNIEAIHLLANMLNY